MPEPTSATPTSAPPTTAGSPRDRLLATASALFYAEGITAVGVDRIVTESAVTRATLYRHFDGKAGLVAAYLEGEDARLRSLADAALATGATGVELLRLVVHGIAQDVAERHTRGCPFINAAAEYPDPASAVRGIVATHRAWFRSTLEQVAAGAGLAEPGEVAAGLVMLRDAALVGGYLDGADAVAATLVRSASALTGLDLS
ncbi:TetR/AcrR family transcriptional regulator [Demequina sp. NBRC 110056]|uniref:TetR/AcrR family transcriptional regulator n=1 Tax=Demequina sp. NBRC 110056 TaxID=1570345 RepID=UPI0009FDBE30|nr:TetR/AcrR family transcriptional regulator [Demequina sp. NBRC 110056]